MQHLSHKHFEKSRQLPCAHRLAEFDANDHIQHCKANDVHVHSVSILSNGAGPCPGFVLEAKRSFLTMLAQMGNHDIAMGQKLLCWCPPSRDKALEAAKVFCAIFRNVDPKARVVADQGKHGGVEANEVFCMLQRVLVEHAGHDPLVAKQHAVTMQELQRLSTQRSRPFGLVGNGSQVLAQALELCWMFDRGWQVLRPFKLGHELFAGRNQELHPVLGAMPSKCLSALIIWTNAGLQLRTQQQDSDPAPSGNRPAIDARAQDQGLDDVEIPKHVLEN